MLAKPQIPRGLRGFLVQMESLELLGLLELLVPMELMEQPVHLGS